MFHHQGEAPTQKPPTKRATTDTRMCSSSIMETAFPLSSVQALCQKRLEMAMYGQEDSIMSCIGACKFDQHLPCHPPKQGALIYDLDNLYCRHAMQRVLSLETPPSSFAECSVIASIATSLTQALKPLLSKTIEEITDPLEDACSSGAPRRQENERTLPFQPPPIRERFRQGGPEPTAQESKGDVGLRARRLQHLGISQLQAFSLGRDTTFDALGPDWDLDLHSMRESRRKHEEEIATLTDRVGNGFPDEDSAFARIAGSRPELASQLDDILGGQQVGDLYSPAAVNKEAFAALYPQAMNPSPRYSHHLLDFMPDIYNKVIWDQWATDYTRNIIRREAQVRVGNDLAFGGGGIGILNEMTQSLVGVRNTFVSTYTNQLQENIGISVVQNQYGVSVNRSNMARAQVAEVLARGVRSATLADIEDRNYGQRVKVRDVDIMMRHDFDEQWSPNPARAATSGFVIARDLSVAVQADITDRLAGVGVSYRMVQASAVTNLTNGWVSAEASVGRGWHGQVTIDIPDQYNDRVLLRTGFGVLGHAYAGAGIGVSDQGLPMFSAEAQLRNVVYGVDWIQDNIYTDRMIAHQTVSIGRFTYIWDSHVWPDEVPAANELMGQKLGAISSLINNFKRPEPLTHLLG